MPSKLTYAALAGACLVGSTDAFASLPVASRPSLRQASARSASAAAAASVSMQMERRSALTFGALAALTAALPAKEASAAGVALGYAMSEKDMNEQLVAFGLKPFDKVRPHSSQHPPNASVPTALFDDARAPAPCGQDICPTHIILHPAVLHALALRPSQPSSL